MYVDSVIIVSMIVGCLAFFLLIAIFIAVFQRELGTKHREKLEEGDVSEKQRLTPMPDEAQVEYTTETVQPDRKTPVSRYPHAQVNRLFQVVWLNFGFCSTKENAFLPEPLLRIAIDVRQRR